jgi:diacylglycerol kinase (ATP)
MSSNHINVKNEDRDSSPRFSIVRQLKSFRYAFAGIKELLISQHNARIHLTATIVVLVLSAVMKISTSEWIAIAFAIGFVWVTEMFNTCIEKTMDYINKEKHPAIKSIKDIAAAAVLIAAITAFVIGLIIFIPKFF